MRYPPRLCAICEKQIPYEFRICKQHKKEYGDQMESEWMKALIDATNQDYNHRVWSFKREIPLDWLAS